MSAPANPGPAPMPSNGRNPLVVFALSPVSPSSWKALGAILLGFVFSVTAFALVTSLLSFGASLLIVLVGIPIIALAVEAARLYARIERWRMGLVDDRPLIQRPHRRLDRARRHADRGPDPRLVRGHLPRRAPLVRRGVRRGVVPSRDHRVHGRGDPRGRWRSRMALAPAAIVIAYAGRRPTCRRLAGGRDPSSSWQSSSSSALVLLPVAASATRGMAVLHRYVVEGLLCISPARRRSGARTSGCARAGQRPSSSRPASCAASSGTSTTARSSGWSCSRSTCRWPRARWTTDPAAAKTLIAGARDQARQALAEIREVVRGTAPGDPARPRARGAPWARSPAGAPVPTFVDSDLAAGRAPAALRSSARRTTS